MKVQFHLHIYKLIKEIDPKAKAGAKISKLE